MIIGMHSVSLLFAGACGAASADAHKYYYLNPTNCCQALWYDIVSCRELQSRRSNVSLTRTYHPIHVRHAVGHEYNCFGPSKLVLPDQAQCLSFLGLA
jgi:hypothetical protein